MAHYYLNTRRMFGASNKIFPYFFFNEVFASTFTMSDPPQKRTETWRGGGRWGFVLKKLQIYRKGKGMSQKYQMQGQNPYT